MKQNFTHYFKYIILAIAFLLSWAVPTFGQEPFQLYICKRLHDDVLHI